MIKCHLFSNEDCDEIHIFAICISKLFISNFVAECGINVALNCVTSFGELVLKTRSESGDFGYICRSDVCLKYLHFI